MIKFIKLKNKDNPYDNTNVEIQVINDANVPDLLEAFKEFMLACGYIIDGDLEVVKEENN